MSQDRNRNNSMQPIPGLRDDYYRNGPTPAVFTHDYANNCLFHNEKQNYKVTSNNTVGFDNSVNSIQQINLSQDQFQRSNLIDNNIEETTKVNTNKHAVIVIDSMDRDIDTYKNSLDFRVKFNPGNGTKTPYVDKKIENITNIGISRIIVPNYVYLEKIDMVLTDTTIDNALLLALGVANPLVLPNTDQTYTTTDEDIIIIWYKQDGNNLYIDFFDIGDTLKHEKVYSAVVNVSDPASKSVTSLCYYTYKGDNATKNEDDRFLLMEIDEFKNVNDYSTNNIRGHSFGTLYHDTVKCNSNICYMESNFSDLSFPNTDLKNISSLSLKFYNSVGDLLDTSSNKNFDITNKTKENVLDSNGKIKYISPSKYIRHPLYLHSQCHIIFNVDYLEPNLNKINFN